MLLPRKQACPQPTLYQFFPNKDAIASALALIYAREMAVAERAIDSEGVIELGQRPSRSCSISV